MSVYKPLNELKLDSPFDLNNTILGGQDFNWGYRQQDQAYYGFTQTSVIKIIGGKGRLFWQTYPNLDDIKLLNQKLRLDVDYKNIVSKITSDKAVFRANQALPGIRLLNQDFEQSVISYLFSPRKNIVSIKTGIKKMRETLGKQIKVQGELFHLFPDIEKVSNLNVDQLKNFGLGFRAKYVKAVSKRLLHDRGKHDFSDNNTARKYLLSLPGVGDKIADCVMVYSLNNDLIMPLDVWGKRILTDIYGLDPKMKYSEMSKWFTSKFGVPSAWAGQILFEWIRKYHKKI